MGGNVETSKHKDGSGSECIKPRPVVAGDEEGRCVRLQGRQDGERKERQWRRHEEDQQPDEYGQRQLVSVAQLYERAARDHVPEVGQSLVGA